MDNRDKLDQYFQTMKKQSSKLRANIEKSKQNMTIMIDKYQVIKRLYIVGIVVNCYLLYRATEKYMKVNRINEQIKENKNILQANLERRRMQLLELAGLESKSDRNKK